MSHDELQTLVDDLADEIGAPVLVEDGRLRLVAFSAHDEDVDGVRAASILRRGASRDVEGWLRERRVPAAVDVVRVPENPRLGMRPRLCLPLRHDGLLHGYLWVPLGPRAPDERVLDAIRRTGAQVAVDLARRRALEHVERERARHLLLTLLRAPAVAERRAAARELVARGVLASGEGYVAVVVRCGAAETAHPSREPLAGALVVAVDAARRALSARQVTSFEVEGGVVALVRASSGSPAAEVDRFVEALLAATRDAAGAARRVVVGVGDLATDVLDCARSLRQAEDAADVAERSTGSSAVARWRELGIDGYLVRLVADAASARRPSLPESLARLLGAEPHDTLVRTLETYLDHGCDATGASKALFLHRATLYRHLARIEELAGVDLRCGRDRLMLHLGLRLWRLGLADAAGRELPGSAASQRPSPA